MQTIKILTAGALLLLGFLAAGAEENDRKYEPCITPAECVDVDNFKFRFLFKYGEHGEYINTDRGCRDRKTFKNHTAKYIPRGLDIIPLISQEAKPTIAFEKNNRYRIENFLAPLNAQDTSFYGAESYRDQTSLVHWSDYFVFLPPPGLVTTGIMLHLRANHKLVVWPMDDPISRERIIIIIDPYLTFSGLCDTYIDNKFEPGMYVYVFKYKYKEQQ